MSTRTSNLPILSLWRRMLVVLQGEISDELAARLSEEVLARIHSEGAEGLVLDVTGVWMIDSHLCSVLSSLAASARLMGTPTIITGMSSDSAQALQAMGIELHAVRTALTVEAAFAELGLVPRITARTRRVRLGKRLRFGDREQVDETEDDGRDERPEDEREVER